MVKAELDFAQYYANSNYLRYGALADGYSRKLHWGLAMQAHFSIVVFILLSPDPIQRCDIVCLLRPSSINCGCLFFNESTLA